MNKPNADVTEQRRWISTYEQEAVLEIDAWRNPDVSAVGKAVKKASAVLDETTDLLRHIPGVNWTLDTLVAGILTKVNEVSQDFVQTKTIYVDLQRAGLRISSPGQAFDHDLRHIDRHTRGLPPKYQALATAEGASTGLIGAAGILPDILALTAINLRAVGEYASYYGFDVQSEEERLCTLNVLNVAAGGSDLQKEYALKPIVRASSSIAKQQVLESAGQAAMSSAIKRAVERLGITLTRKKVAQLMPIAGAVVGGSFNLYYTSKVCSTAYQFYRERFLVERHGPDVMKRAAGPPAG
ncbi:MAG: EcsC family protein [Rhodothermales bacterium]|nr:EcsC family protein [Rhodothermales bacterium]